MPRVVLLPGLGLVAAAASAKDAAVAADIAEATIDVVSAAEAQARYESIGEADIFDMEYWSLEQAKLGKNQEKRLARHIVAVAGGASGIGAATARAFAAEGAEVLVLDIDGEGAGRLAKEIGGGVLPITRFAVDAYVHFVRERSLLEGVASSLTELYAPAIHRERIDGLLKHCAFADEVTTSYFQRRLAQAPRDAAFALAYVKREARTPAERQAVCNAVVFKCDTLWAALDALEHAYLENNIPAGAFVPDRWEWG